MRPTDSTGRAALVTGGSRGIGLAIARVLAEEGYGLTLAADVAPQVEATVGELEGTGAVVHGAVADLAEEAGVTGMVATHQETHGRLDVLVNNAGVAVGQRVEEIRTERLDRLLAVNLRAAVLATREALPLLRRAGAEHGKALIVNMASVTGKDGHGGLSVYGATKRALIVLTRSTEREVDGAGVACTALAPGLVATPMTSFVRNPEQAIRPADVAEAVRFLLRTSPRCHVPEIVLRRPGEEPRPG